MVLFPAMLQHLGFQLRHHHVSHLPYLLPPLCTIPAGPFLMGSDPQRDADASPEERPQHTVQLSLYALGTYPVTVAEYACAIEAQAAGVRKPRGIQLEKLWEDQLRYPTRPVYGLTWYDALGYTHWLADMTGQPWRLPTEAEWEKAARGPDGDLYPWGNQWDARNANMHREEHQTEKRSPTSIEAYAHAASSYGVIDMVGNVAEWTSTIYNEKDFPYPYVATDGREKQEEEGRGRFRRIRGGCWLSEPVGGRAASRDFFHVDDRFDWPYGMRLALTSTR